MCGTCGHPRTDRYAPIVAQNGVDADQILDAGLKLFDSCGGLVPRYSKLLVKAARTGGHVGDKVFSHQHLVVPGQVHCGSGDLADSEVLGRRHWRE